MALPSKGLREKFNFLQSIRNLIPVHWSAPASQLLYDLPVNDDETDA
jgi:hypothetical protein